MYTRLPVTSCLYTKKNAVPASVYTLKTSYLTPILKKKPLPGGGVLTVMSDTICRLISVSVKVEKNKLLKLTSYLRFIVAVVDSKV